MPVSDELDKATDEMMPARLRGHHLLCILTYRGHGYTPDFVANMSAVVADIAGGRRARLVEGPDDICGGLTAADRIACDHDCGRRETRRLDIAAIADIEEHVGIDLAGEIEIDRTLVRRLRALFADRAIRAVCRRCAWSDLCTTIASEGFAGTRLFPPERPVLLR